MLRVGLTGGMATGKTFVARELERLGCHVIYADEIGREVMQPDGEAYAGIVAEFGADVVDAEGYIQRPVLASRVFGNPERLAVLNGLVHPSVWRREEQLMAGFEKNDPRGITVLEAAILIETGTYHRFQKLILTVCPRERQIERAMHRDGITREQAEARLRSQMPLEEKIPYADYVIDTSGPKEETVLRVRELHQALRREAI